MEKVISITGLGEFSQNDGTLESNKTFEVPVFQNHSCSIVLKDYMQENETGKQEMINCALNLLGCNESVLRDAATHVFKYYKYFCEIADDSSLPKIRNAAAVWKHVEFGSSIIIQRRSFGDKGLYASLECECDWEPEHGLQIVLKEGKRITKVGPYDGHLTNSDAYDDPKFEDVVYVN